MSFKLNCSVAPATVSVARSLLILRLISATVSLLDLKLIVRSEPLATAQMFKSITDTRIVERGLIRVRLTFQAQPRRHGTRRLQPERDVAVRCKRIAWLGHVVISE